MQFGKGKPSVGIFYDCDLGESIDSVLALAVLYGMQGKQEARVASLSLSRPDLNTLMFSEVLQRFFSGVPAGQDNGGGVGTMKYVPVGMPLESKRSAGAIAAKPAVAATLTSNKSQVKDSRDSADPCTLYRNLLQAQFDDNAIFVLAGPATNLAAALAFRGMKELLAAKVRYLVVAGSPAYMKSDLPAARKLFAEWPTPVVAVGPEVVKDLDFPGVSIEKEFALIPNHPVAAAYKGYRTMPYNSPSLDMAAALYAGRPKEGYFQVSGAGTITVGDDGSLQCVEASSGRHRWLIADPAQKDKILQTYVELASAKPVPPPKRVRPDAAAAAAAAEAADKAAAVTPKP